MEIKKLMKNREKAMAFISSEYELLTLGATDDKI